MVRKLNGNGPSVVVRSVVPCTFPFLPWMPVRVEAEELAVTPLQTRRAPRNLVIRGQDKHVAGNKDYHETFRDQLSVTTMSDSAVEVSSQRIEHPGPAWVRAP